MSVCNTGQYLGPLNTCIVVPAAQGTACDDDHFCTIGDACDGNGSCVGGSQNDCGLPHSPCLSTICYEDTKSCNVTPVNDGAACTPTDLCQSNGVCSIGDCIGEPKDCSFSPQNECNSVACDPATGKCAATPDASKDDAPCSLSGDPCNINKTCMAGLCGGGTPKDCSTFNVGCQIGLCDDTTGNCNPAPAPVGTACSDGIAECHVGTCDAKGGCSPSSAPDGTACNDHNACTKADTCMAGACAGGPVSGCSVYLQEGFESCPAGWTLSGDWQCGTPKNVGPLAAHTGNNCIATQIAGNYSVNQSYSTCVADSPAIDLSMAMSPQLSFWVWDHTEGGTFDGWNLKVSADAGQTFTEVTMVTPAYSLTVAGQPAWGGDHSVAGWQNYLADLSAYHGKSIILRFAFRSDGATVYPGVYIDDLVVAEPLQIPLYISTPTPLADVYVGTPYVATMAKTGGTSTSVWSIKPGGVNTSWLSIDPTTGVLSGTPTAANVGLVSVTVHVEEQLLPSNFAEKTFTFHVKPDVYYTGFEGACPDGWTLTGDWQCGAPTTVGPMAAYAGTQCLATQLSSNYHDNQPWTTTATSPIIDLTGVQNPLLTFRMWIDTEGATYDGANLQLSTDGGMSYTILTNVMPAYTLTVAGYPAWGGHQSALGWQAVTVDLSAYTNQAIRLQFAFHSDTSGNYPGVYIDEILIN
jgi:hypothetical protein